MAKHSTPPIRNQVSRRTSMRAPLSLRGQQNSGVTSEDADHTHEYLVDQNGNGWALTAFFPQEPKINHKHRVINWIIQSAKSGCYPNCESLYGYPGAPPHIHTIGNSGANINNNTGTRPIG